ncbi:hypothetical protein Tco_1300811 [Tanacetum coccineum]
MEEPLEIMDCEVKRLKHSKENNEVLEANGQGSLDEVMNEELEMDGIDTDGKSYKWCGLKPVADTLKNKNVEGISKIASRLGTPIIMDRITTSMCEPAYGRVSYATVLIEVDATKGLVDSIDACYKSIGRTMKLRNKELTEEEIVKETKDKGKRVDKLGEDKGNDDGWRSVSYRKENYNGRGNVGGSVRIPIRNVNQDSSSKPVTTKYVQVGNKENKESDGFVNVSKKGKVEVNIASQDKNVSQEGIHISNILSALDNEGDDADMDEDQVVGNDTDMGYKTNTRSGKIKQANEIVKKKMQETGLSRNLVMPGLYDEIYRQESDNIQVLNTKKQIEDTDNMGEEVAEDTSVHASFMTQDNVSNVVDSGMAQMQSVEDIPMTGMFYTWIQKRHDPDSSILKKLERIMGNCHFLDVFIACTAHFLPYNISDHSPAVLIINNICSKNPKPFRFMNFLVEKPEILKTVKENWHVPVEGFAIQKSKIEWQKEGDLNNAYFHNFIKGRLNKCIIESINDEDRVSYTGKDVADIFLGHFQKIFGVEGETYPVEDPD